MCSRTWKSSLEAVLSGLSNTFITFLRSCLRHGLLSSSGNLGREAIHVSQRQSHEHFMIDGVLLISVEPLKIQKDDEVLATSAMQRLGKETSVDCLCVRCLFGLFLRAHSYFLAAMQLAQLPSWNLVLPPSLAPLHPFTHPPRYRQLFFACLRVFPACCASQK